MPIPTILGNSGYSGTLLLWLPRHCGLLELAREMVVGLVRVRGPPENFRAMCPTIGAGIADLQLER